MFEPKTAADLPEGSEITREGRTWTAGNRDLAERWEIAMEPDDWWGMQRTATDAEMDRWLADGAFITRVPVGRASKAGD